MKTSPECTYAFSLSEIRPEDKSLGNTVLTGAVSDVFMRAGLPRRHYRVSLWDNKVATTVQGEIDGDQPMNYVRLCFLLMKDAVMEHAVQHGSDSEAKFNKMLRDENDRLDRMTARARAALE